MRAAAVGMLGVVTTRNSSSFPMISNQCHFVERALLGFRLGSKQSCLYSSSDFSYGIQYKVRSGV